MTVVRGLLVGVLRKIIEVFLFDENRAALLLETGEYLNINAWSHS